MANHVEGLQRRFFPAKLKAEGDDAIVITLLGVAQLARPWGRDKDGCLKIEQDDLKILSFLN